MIPDRKYEYTYDDDGNQTLNVSYTWDTENQSFITNIKSEYTYDDNGNQILSISYNWNTNSQSFVPGIKFEHTWDDNGNLTEYVNYTWNTETLSFVPNYKYERFFDDNGNLILNISYNWDAETQSFIPSGSKYEYTFDDNGNITLSISYTWDTETQSFVPDTKYEYTFYDDENQTLSISYTWDTETQSFIANIKSEHTYDDNGNLILNTSYTWNTENQSFIPTSKVEMAWDDNGNRTLFMISTWDTDSQSFVSNFKDEFTFDATFGTQTRYVRYAWNSITELFYEYSKKIYSLDEFGNILDVEVYDWYSDLGLMKPKNKTVYSTILETETNLVREGITYEYDTNFNTWNELEGEALKSYWYYTKVSTLSTENIDSSKVTVYPNPTSSIVTIKANKNYDIQVYDITGRIVMTHTGNTIDMSHLSPATYIIKALDSSTNQELTYRIVKK